MSARWNFMGNAGTANTGLKYLIENLTFVEQVVNINNIPFGLYLYLLPLALLGCLRACSVDVVVPGVPRALSVDQR